MRISEQMKAKGIVGWCWSCGGRIFTWDEAAVTKAGRLFCAVYCMNDHEAGDSTPPDTGFDAEWKKEIAREEGMLNGIDSFNDWSL